MARTVPAAIQTAIQSTAFDLPILLHMRLADGTVKTLTTWDKELSVDLLGEGSLEYSPAGIEGLTDFSAQINAPIDDTELMLMIDGSTFTADKARRSRYDNAVVTKGYVLPDTLGSPWLYAKYDTGRVTVEGVRIRLELMGPEKRLEQPVSRVLTANCPFVFGDNDCGMQVRADAWAATTAYSTYSIVKRATGSGIYWFKATTGGTSDASEPTWPGTLGGTVVDGTVTWTAIRARRLTGTVSGVTSKTVFAATGISVLSDWFGEGELTWLTGDNAGDKGRAASDDGAGNLTLKSAAYDAIQVGDTFEVVAGCRKRLTEDCIGKHDNGNNSRTRTLRFGGDPFLADENVTLSAEKG